MPPRVGKLFDNIDASLAAWIGEQALFFVATAPLSADGHVNVSPKGPIGSLRVVDPTTLAYLERRRERCRDHCAPSRKRPDRDHVLRLRRSAADRPSSWPRRGRVEWRFAIRVADEAVCLRGSRVYPRRDARSFSYTPSASPIRAAMGCRSCTTRERERKCVTGRKEARYRRRCRDRRVSTREERNQHRRPSGHRSAHLSRPSVDLCSDPPEAVQGWVSPNDFEFLLSNTVMPTPCSASDIRR